MLHYDTNVQNQRDHHKTYGIKGRAKYGLMIVLAGATSGIPKELFSDEELRDGSS